VLACLLEANANVESVMFDEPSLEDVFLMLTHRGLEQADA